MDTTRDHALDLLKGIGSIGVVFMHIMFPGIGGEVVHKLAEFAVPVFAMISGYYAYGTTNEIIKKRLIRIIRIFLFAFVLYTVYAIFDNGLHFILEDVNAGHILRVLVKAVAFCTIDYAIPLWYLIAIIETYVLWLCINNHKRINDGCMRIMIVFLFALSICSRIILETLHMPWYLKINFITCTLPWFLFGYYLKNPENKVLSILSDFMIIVLAICGLLVALIPVLFPISVQFSFLGVVFYSISVFVLAVRHSKTSICPMLEYIGKNLSLNIYIFHVFIGGVIGFFCNRIHVTTSNWYLWGHPIFAVLCSICFAWIIDKLRTVIEYRV